MPERMDRQEHDHAEVAAAREAAAMATRFRR